MKRETNREDRVRAVSSRQILHDQTINKWYKVYHLLLSFRIIQKRIAHIRSYRAKVDW